MKKFIISSAFLLGLALTTQAQCDKKLTLNASKAIFYNVDGNEENTKESSIVIEITKTTIFINPGDGENDKVNGTIKELVCEWKEPLKNGKSSSSKVEFTDPNGNLKTGKITVEAKDGVITFWLELDEWAGRKIKVPVEKAKEE